MNKKQDGSQLHGSLQEFYDRSAEGLQYSENRKLHALLLEYGGIFSKNDQDLGRTSITSHKIDTGDSKPVRRLPRRLPISQVDEARKAIETMAKDGIIEQSSSPWMACIVLVKKKDGTTRFCADCRILNEVTKKDSYPLPWIYTALDAFAGSRWFSSLDLKSGYWQVELDNEAREKAHRIRSVRLTMDNLSCISR